MRRKSWASRTKKKELISLPTGWTSSHPPALPKVRKGSPHQGRSERRQWHLTDLLQEGEDERVGRWMGYQKESPRREGNEGDFPGEGGHIKVTSLATNVGQGLVTCRQKRKALEDKIKGKGIIASASRLRLSY